MTGEAASVLLALVAAAQLGFQLTVTTLVYPALAEATAPDWHAVHERHSRRVVAPVVVLYGGLVLLVPTALLTASSSGHPWLVASAGCATALVLVTMALAAPTHGALGRSLPDGRRRLLIRLRRVDLVRLLLSGALVACTAGAALAG